MKNLSLPKTIYLREYQKPDYLTPEVELWFDLKEDYVCVRSRLQVVRNSPKAKKLVLDGERLELISVSLNGKKLSSSQYQVTEKDLTLNQVPEKFTLEIETKIQPQLNKSLEGLYCSRGIFCTQNEAQGFRKITYFVDRPDNMCRFTTHIKADSQKYPVLLSNGNLVESQELEEHHCCVTWKDPFPKPCYLFALVAGNLGVIHDHFVTRSKRKVKLEIYVEKGNESRADYAMQSLKHAMEWDEKTFGLEYDLDLYMIVAVDDFNFGAMENKGLNIFNSQYVLANPETATDQNFQGIEGVIGHEYFHNWTGNRVTCRDWFQLTLKEGLTVFRDQEFSSDMTSRAVKRMDDVRMLKDYQFAEDAGPNAHPIRPASYIEINNFYTSTVYQKGAEVIRMIETFIGKETFKKGITKYFELYDGQAVTCDDFVHAMELASKQDLTKFKRWYSQPGTPVVEVKSKYDAKKQTFTLNVMQKKPKHPLAKKNQPYVMPMKTALIDAKGQMLSLVQSASKKKEKPVKEKVLAISKPEETFIFHGIKSKPIPSLFRNFSAPIQLITDQTREDLIFLLAYDTDPVNRYEAGQRLLTQELLRLINAKQKGKTAIPESAVIKAMGSLVQGKIQDPAFCAEALILPSEASLLQALPVCDFDTVHETRRYLIRTFAENFKKELLGIYREFHQAKKYSIDPVSIGRRSLKNIALRYLQIANEKEVLGLIDAQYRKATNMTDALAALSMLCDNDTAQKKSALDHFYHKWNRDPLVMNKWFSVQAASRSAQTLEQIKFLEKDFAFDPKNPNKLRSLYGVFSGNFIRFHDISGKGYRFFADKILSINEFNPGVAAKLSAAAFKYYAKLDPKRQALLKKELDRILQSKPSQDVFEIVSKTLQSAKK